jgi:Protein of unknown function (DUF4038)
MKKKQRDKPINLVGSKIVGKQFLKSLLWHTLVFLSFPISSFGQWNLTIAENKQSFQLDGNKPFFWLGDTAWEIIHRLNREEIKQYFEARSKQGFNVIQIMILTEFNGLTQKNRHGDLPLHNFDPTRLDITPGNNPNDSVAYDYWDHLEFVIEEAAKHQMFMALIPTWGDKVAQTKGIGPKIFNEQNAKIYYLVERW